MLKRRTVQHNKHDARIGDTRLLGTGVSFTTYGWGNVPYVLRQSILKKQHLRFRPPLARIAQPNQFNQIIRSGNLGFGRHGSSSDPGCIYTISQRGFRPIHTRGRPLLRGNTNMIMAGAMSFNRFWEGKESGHSYVCVSTKDIVVRS